MKTKTSIWMRRLAGLSAIALVFTSFVGQASARILFQDDTTGTYESENLNIGSNDAGANNTSVKFGADTTASENGNINWNITTNTFEVDHTTAITGGLSATGQVNFSGAAGTRLRENANPTANSACTTLNEVIMNTTSHKLEVCTTVGIAGSAVWTAPSPAVPTGTPNPATCAIGDLFFNTTSATLQVCTALNTWGTAGPQDFESVYGKDSDHILTTTNNPFTIDAGTSTMAVNGAGGISLNTNVNGTTNINTGTSTGTVNIGTGATTQALHVGDGAGVKTVTLGSTNTTSGTTIASGSTAGVLNVNASNGTAVTNIGTGTTSGTVSIGGNADQVAIDSSTWDISGAGVASGLTGITSAGGAVSLNNNSNFNVDIATGSSTGVVTIGGTGTQTIAVGNGAGVKTVSLGSTNTTSGTTIASGSTAGVLNVNASNGTAVTNIGTGTTSGAVNVGTGTGNVTVGNATGTTAINGSVWSINTSGVANLAGVTSTGTVNFSGTSAQRMRESSSPNTLAACATLNEVIINTTSHSLMVCTTIGAAGVAIWTAPAPAVPTGTPNPATCSIGQLFFNTTSATLQVCTAADTWGTAGPQDFESVYTKDADKVLTTSNGNFTVDAGSGVISNTATGGINLNANTNGTTNINTGTSTGAVNIGTGATTQALHVGDGAGVKTVTLGSTNTTSGTTIASGSTAGVLNVNASNGTAVTNIGTGTTSGTVSIGGNADQVAIDSSTWDISGAGVASGLTGVTSTGTVNFSGTSAQRMRESSSPNTLAACATLNEVIINTTSHSLMVCTTIGAAGVAIWTAPAPAVPTGTPNPATCSIGQLFFNTTSATLQVCTAADTWGTAGPQDFESVYAKDADHTLTTTNNPFTIAAGTSTVAVNGLGGVSINTGVNGTTNINTGSSTGAVNVGTGAGNVSVGNATGTVGIASSVWNITTAGVASGLTGLTSANGAVSLNNNSGVNTTGIGTGTTTGAVTIGGGSDTIQINSSNWKVSTLGVASGLTGITSTGTVDLTGASRFGMPQVASNPGTCVKGDEVFNTTDSFVYICTATNFWTKQASGKVDEMNWEPEYPDTVVFKSGSNNNGTLISDYDSTNFHQFYDWTSTRATLQSIDLRFRYKIPSDFTSTGNLTMRLRTLTTSNLDNKVDLTLRNDTDNAVCSTTIDKQVSGTANTWDLVTMTAANINTGCTGATALAAGKIIEIQIRNYAKSTGATDVGTVNLAYTN